MDNESIKQKVNEIIYEVLQDRISFEDITADKHLLEDLGAESSEILEIFLTIMAEFDIEIDRNSIMKLSNLGALYDYIENLIIQNAEV